MIERNLLCSIIITKAMSLHIKTYILVSYQLDGLSTGIRKYSLYAEFIQSWYGRLHQQLCCYLMLFSIFIHYIHCMWNRAGFSSVSAIFFKIAHITRIREDLFMYWEVRGVWNFYLKSYYTKLFYYAHYVLYYVINNNMWLYIIIIWYY